MLDILIVDDEPAAIKSLMYLIDWEQEGYEIAAVAYNGEMALQLMRDQSFSLVITDVRMPEMDGLAFIRKLRQTSAIPVIILSGYNDFEYAKQGMRLGIKDYLLKPVEVGELKEKLAQIKEEIESANLLESKLYHSIPMMRNQLLHDWTHGILDDPYLLQQLDLPLFNENDAPYCVMMVELEHEQDTKENVIAWNHDLRLKRFAVRNIMEEICEGKGYVFVESDSRFGIVLTSEEANFEDAMTKLAEQIYESVLHYAKQKITIAIGPKVDAFDQVTLSYLPAVKTLNSKSFHEEGPVLKSHEAGTWQQDQKSVSVIEEVKANIHKQFAHSINLRLMASQVFLSPAYLGQLFRMVEGITFNQYVLKVRMEHAKKLLRNTDKKIYEIANEVGYRELDWFYKKFKEYTGVSASEYRVK